MPPCHAFSDIDAMMILAYYFIIDAIFRWACRHFSPFSFARLPTVYDCHHHAKSDLKTTFHRPRHAAIIAIDYCHFR
jgi:hypothetical protein